MMALNMSLGMLEMEVPLPWMLDNLEASAAHVSVLPIRGTHLLMHSLQIKDE